MTKICAGTQQYDIACVVFDKDGTLMDFEQAWGRRIRLWIAALVAAADGEEALAAGRCKGHYSQYAQCGITIAVATADNRDISERCLEILDVSQDVALLMCGDDPLPQKPDPRVLAWIGAELNIEPAKILMVGDTMNDMLTGRNANAAGCIGISPPAATDQQCSLRLPMLC